MVRQLENYFEDILSPYISGFRKTHSCETVLIRMVEHIKKSLDNGKNCMRSFNGSLKSIRLYFT